MLLLRSDHPTMDTKSVLMSLDKGMYAHSECSFPSFDKDI